MRCSESAFRYGASVLAGEVPACSWVRLACQRFFRDLERSEAGELPFRLEVARADRVAAAVSCFQHFKGPLAGEPVQLEPWQCFIVTNLFGWVDDTGAWRFREANIFVPRGNGKTTLAAPLALVLGFMGGEGGAEVYSAAANADQARICFDAARAMARRVTPQDAKGRPLPGGWGPTFNVEVRQHDIVAKDGSIFRPLASQTKGLDGLNVYFAVLDEICSHRTPEVYDALNTGTAKRLQAMLFLISTATANTTGIGRSRWKYLEKVLLGEVEDERTFGIIYTIDDDDDPFDPLSWRKANPNWGVSVMPAQFEKNAKQAQISPEREAAFKTRHLNLWVGAEEGMFSPRSWQACQQSELRLEDFEGEECFLGLDMASHVDLVGLAYLFPAGDRWTCFARGWVPKSQILSGQVDAYAGWAKDGSLEVHDAEAIDVERIKHEVLDACRRFRVLAAGFDEWQSIFLMQAVQEQFPDVTCVSLRPTPKDMSRACRELQRRIVTGQIQHDGNPVLSWCMGNVVGKEDPNQNVRPTKEHNANKIDLAVALIQATAVALLEPEPVEMELAWL